VNGTFLGRVAEGQETPAEARRNGGGVRAASGGVKITSNGRFENHVVIS